MQNTPTPHPKPSMRSMPWYRTCGHTHQPPQSKIQSCKWTVSCQPQLHCQLPPCLRKQWQKLYTHPWSWPGGPQPPQLEVYSTPPTIATKCPWKEYRANEEVRWKPKQPKALSALREIQKLQEEVEPILPWQPFVRLVHELLFTRGPYRIQRQAIQALRAAAEAYIMEVLGGGNLACMHQDRCTLAPKDIRLFHRLWGNVDLMGETPESEEARRADWRRYKKDRLTPGEAMVLDTTQRRKLRALIQRRRQKLQKNLKH